LAGSFSNGDISFGGLPTWVCSLAVVLLFQVYQPEVELDSSCLSHPRFPTPVHPTSFLLQSSPYPLSVHLTHPLCFHTILALGLASLLTHLPPPPRILGPAPEPSEPPDYPQSLSGSQLNYYIVPYHSPTHFIYLSHPIFLRCVILELESCLLICPAHPPVISHG
jgi:hypothetical protein